MQVAGRIGRRYGTPHEKGAINFEGKLEDQTRVEAKGQRHIPSSKGPEEREGSEPVSL